MQTHRTIRYHLYPATQKKHRKLHGTAGACRYVWNHFVGKLKDEYEYYGESRFNFFTLGKQFTTLRKCCDQWLQGYSAYIVKSSLQPIEIAYKGFLKGNNGLPKFHGKYTHSPSFPINYQSAKISGCHLYIQKVGWMKFAGGDRYKGEKFVSGQVKYECGKWYAYITYEVEVPSRSHPVAAVGLDRNCGQVALSDGTMYHLPDLKRKEARRRRYQRMVARRVTGSNRRKLAKHRLRKAYQAERFARANWCHQTSRLIADQYDIVYIEGLNTAGMTKSAKGTIDNPGKNVKAKSGLNREILKSGWYKLEQCLSYKACIEKVNPAYTSQTCNQCGSVNKASRKTRSIFKCRHCGHEDNADVNAALNILAAGSTATGCGDGGSGNTSRSMKRQKDRVARPAKKSVKLPI